MTNSISSLCLVVVVITFPSCCIIIVFIFSIISMLLVLLQSINAPFIWSFCTLAFSSFYWVSWSSWSNCLWILNYLFPIPIIASKSKGSMCLQHIFIHTKLHLANVPLLKGVVNSFSHGSLHIPCLFSWSVNELHHLHLHGILVV